MLRQALAIILLSSNMEGMADPIDNLATELSSIRAEIETIQGQIDQDKEDFKSQMQSLNLAKADLVATNQREDLKIRQNRKMTEETAVSLKEKFAGDSDIEGLVLKTTAALSAHISQSLPFKREERLKDVKDIESKISDHLMNPYKAANKLWGLIEDELRLQKDIGIYKQIIVIGDQEQLCEIAKFGMMTYYFKTPDNQYGKMSRNDQQWNVTLLPDSSDIAQVEDVFTLLKKQIRVGVFNLPKFI